MIISAKQKRFFGIAVAAYFLVICLITGTCYWIITAMRNPTRDGYLLLGLAVIGIAATLGIVFVALNALIATPGRSILNVTKTAKYLALLNLLIAIGFFVVAFSTTE